MRRTPWTLALTPGGVGRPGLGGAPAGCQTEDEGQSSPAGTIGGRPMRLPMMALAATAMLAAPAPVFAQDTASSEFQRICLNNRANLTQAVNQAKALGYADYPAPKPAGIDTMWGMNKTASDGRGWAVVVTQSRVAGAGATPNQAYEACNVTGPLGTPDSKAAVKAWVGVAPQEESPTKVYYVYTERAGKRAAVNGADEAAMVAAIKSGGFWVLQIEDTDGKTGLTLLSVKQAP